MINKPIDNLHKVITEDNGIFRNLCLEKFNLPTNILDWTVGGGNLDMYFKIMLKWLIKY